MGGDNDLLRRRISGRACVFALSLAVLSRCGLEFSTRLQFSAKTSFQRSDPFCAMQSLFSADSAFAAMRGRHSASPGSGLEPLLYDDCVPRLFFPPPNRFRFPPSVRGAAELYCISSHSVLPNSCPKWRPLRDCCVCSSSRKDRPTISAPSPQARLG